MRRVGYAQVEQRVPRKPAEPVNSRLKRMQTSGRGDGRKVQKRIELVIVRCDGPMQPLLQGVEQPVDDGQLHEQREAPAKHAEIVRFEEGLLRLEEAVLVALVLPLQLCKLRLERLPLLLLAGLFEAEGCQRQPNEEGEHQDGQPQIMQASVEGQEHIE